MEDEELEGRDTGKIFYSFLTNTMSSFFMVCPIFLEIHAGLLCLPATANSANPHYN